MEEWVIKKKELFELSRFYNYKETRKIHKEFENVLYLIDELIRLSKSEDEDDEDGLDVLHMIQESLHIIETLLGIHYDETKDRDTKKVIDNFERFKK